MMPRFAASLRFFSIFFEMHFFSPLRQFLQLSIFSSWLHAFALTAAAAHISPPFSCHYLFAYAFAAATLPPTSPPLMLPPPLFADTLRRFFDTLFTPRRLMLSFS